DGVLVVFHDETLDRMCSVNGKVIDYTFDELQAFKLGDSDELIPTFADVLNVVSGKIPLIIEIKMHTACTKVCVATNKALENYQGPYCIESFHPVAVRWYRKNRPDVIRGQLSSNFKNESLSHFIVQHLLTNFITKPDFIAYGHQYHTGLSRQLCQKLYRCLSVAWTIKSQAELDACRDSFDLFIFEGFIPDQKS
ncbi:MAG: glycerophosphodiester phosphodiesterase family protein, partial [Turicibacter sp.]